METKLSEHSRQALANSRDEAIRLKTGAIGVEQLYLGIVRESDCSAVKMLSDLGADLPAIKSKIENTVGQINSNLRFSQDSEIPMLKQTEKVLRLSFLESTRLKSKEIHTVHIILAILKESESYVSELLKQYGITSEKCVKYLQNRGMLPPTTSANDLSSPIPDFRSQTSEDNNDDPYADPDEDTIKSFSNQSKDAPQNNSTPALENFGRDLTKIAREGKLDPVVGREKELERIAQILSRRKKNNPILIGEPGVGKSAIAEGLALRIIEGRVPRTLYDKRVISLDLASLVAGTKYRGQFEERMKVILNELERNPDIIVFIDEIHTIVGAGSASGSLDASNMFKPALARGEIQCIGTTTLDEYRQYIEKDGALERRFQKVLVEATSPEETLTILKNIKTKYEDHHAVNYTDAALKACITLTERYVSDRVLPDKAIDALDEAGARVRIAHIEVPEEILKLENEIARVEQLKKEVLKDKQYNVAAEYRDRVRMLRDKLTRGREISGTLNMLDSVKAGEDKHIMPYKYRANFEFDTFLKYELNVYKALLGDDVKALAATDEDGFPGRAEFDRLRGAGLRLASAKLGSRRIGDRLGNLADGGRRKGAHAQRREPERQVIRPEKRPRGERRAVLERVHVVHEAPPHELVLHLQRAPLDIGVFRHVQIRRVQEAEAPMRVRAPRVLDREAPHRPRDARQDHPGRHPLGAADVRHRLLQRVRPVLHRRHERRAGL